jgi:hypothetical protein
VVEKEGKQCTRESDCRITPVEKRGRGKSPEQNIPDDSASQGRTESEDQDANEVQISVDGRHGAFYGEHHGSRNVCG